MQIYICDPHYQEETIKTGGILTWKKVVSSDYGDPKSCFGVTGKS